MSISTFQTKSTEANKLREQNNEVQLKIKELEHNISKHRKDSQDAADKVHANSLAHSPPTAVTLNVVLIQKIGVSFIFSRMT